MKASIFFSVPGLWNYLDDLTTNIVPPRIIPASVSRSPLEAPV
jgi:hypothetical protein